MTNPNPCEQFLNDVSDHVMTVELDQGVHRCLHFGEPGSVIGSFRLITWPGGLTITGDMGTYSFSRLRDMFDFFQGRDDSLSINPDYWSQKLTSVCSTDGAFVYSHERFVEAVTDHFNSFWEEDEDHPEYDESWEAVREQLIEGDFNSEDLAMYAAFSFNFDIDGGDRSLVFDDFWDNSLTVIAPRLRWCMYAIVWGIQRYRAETPSDSE